MFPVLPLKSLSLAHIARAWARLHVALWDFFQIILRYILWLDFIQKMRKKITQARKSHLLGTSLPIFNNVVHRRWPVCGARASWRFLNKNSSIMMQRSRAHHTSESQQKKKKAKQSGFFSWVKEKQRKRSRRDWNSRSLLSGRTRDRMNGAQSSGRWV